MRHSQSSKARAIELYQQGRASRWIAEVVGGGCTKSAVLRWVRKAGVTVRPKGDPRWIDHAKIRELARRGMSHRSIAQEVGCCKRSVANVMRREHALGRGVRDDERVAR